MPKNTVKILLIIPAIAILLVGYLVLKPQEAPQQAIAVEQTETPQAIQKQPEIKLYTPQELLEITNTIRTENGVPAMTLDENLNLSASLKLEEMTRESNFEHVSARTGKRGISYIQENTTYCYFGNENLQRVTPYVNQIRDFKGSKGHWDAVINLDYESVGFAMNDRYLVMHSCDKDPN